MYNLLKDMFLQDRCEHSLKMIGVPAITFIPSKTQYDVEDSANEFTVHLSLGELVTSTIKKRKADDRI